MRVLGLDVGESRIGVALSDPLGMMASALTVIGVKSTESAIQEILGLVAQYEVERIVVGLPRSLDGSIGKQAQSVLDFVELLSQRTSVPVATWDERLSTVAAERVLLEAGTKREKRRQHRDAVAAAIVLQAYLDRERIQASTQD